LKAERTINGKTGSSVTDNLSSTGDLVRVESVSKKFCRSLKKSLWYGLQDIAYDLNPFSNSRSEPQAKSNASDRQRATSPFLREGEFWAVNDVSFQLRRGECLGLMGRNGAGKTTLLKMLTGLIKPDAGRIIMRGRVCALIALGAGFNPILTGRENIHVNASVLGLSMREIDMKIEEIIDFSELRDFIDSPVQSYSSGMQVRLGFAVATALDPDVLILDEVLAVGDASFRSKCYRRIGELLDRCAVIFVSHAIEQIARISTSALVLDRGRQVFRGVPAAAAAHYRTLDTAVPGAQESAAFSTSHSPLSQYDVSCGQTTVRHGDFLDILLVTLSSDAVTGFARIQFYSDSEAVVAETHDVMLNLTAATREYSELKAGPVHLKPGTYRLSVPFTSRNRISILGWSFQLLKIQVAGEACVFSDYIVPCECSNYSGRT
jgi:homopolymeric O-antigen transport system ATP-binding protein